jgi:hypothetical protein
MMGGRLHPNGIPHWAPWEALRLHWWPEDHLDPVLTTTRERQIRTAEEIEAAIQEPMRVAPTRNVWIHECLKDEARRGVGDDGDKPCGDAARLGGNALFPYGPVVLYDSGMWAMEMSTMAC